MDKLHSSFEVECSNHCQFSLGWIHAATISVKRASGIPTITTLAIPGCSSRIASTYKQITCSRLPETFNKTRQQALNYVKKDKK